MNQISIDNQKIIDATENWIQTVIGEQNWDCIKRANEINKLFTSDGRLLGTVSQLMRTKNSNPQLKEYFLYFSRSNLEKLDVISKKYYINKITDNVYENSAFIRWKLDDNKYVTAIMTFIFRKENGKWKIVLLNSTPIHKNPPELLKKQGDSFKYWNL